jgi:hypothetical protein
LVVVVVVVVVAAKTRKQASKVILTNDMGWSRTPRLYLMETHSLVLLLPHIETNPSKTMID